ncbi:hypothetical protein MIMGU_mgv1a0267592mg, partial [Erythranthe guttata]
MILIWRIDKFDFVACMGAFFGVVFASVEIGLLIAGAISFAKIIFQVTRPRTVVLGRIPRTTVYRNIEQYPEATKISGIMIGRVDSAIYFSNSNYIGGRIACVYNAGYTTAYEEEDRINEDNRERIRFLIVELSPVTDIDTSGIHALEDLYKSLQKRDIQLVVANPGQVVLDKLHSSGFVKTVGEDAVFMTVGDAVFTLGHISEP